MYKAGGSTRDTALINLKMRSTHKSSYASCITGTNLAKVLEESRLLLPDEQLNLFDELTLVRHIAAQALKDYEKAVTLKEAASLSNNEKEYEKSSILVSYAGALLNEKLKHVKEMCESAHKMMSSRHNVNLNALGFSDLIAYVMGVVNNNTATTIDAEKIEVQLRENMGALSPIDADRGVSSEPSDDKIISEMDQTIPKTA